MPPEPSWSAHLPSSSYRASFYLRGCPGSTSLPSLTQGHTPSSTVHAIPSAWRALLHLLPDSTCLSSDLSPGVLKPHQSQSFRAPSRQHHGPPHHSRVMVHGVFVVVWSMPVSSLRTGALSAFAHSCIPNVWYPAWRRARAPSIFVEWGKQILNLPWVSHSRGPGAPGGVLAGL